MGGVTTVTAAEHSPFIRLRIKARAAAVWVIERTPLISGLPNCSYNHFRDATKETFVKLILSTSPLWLGSLIVFGVGKTEKTTEAYLNILNSSVSKGEMLLFATSAIAPIFFFALTPPKHDRDFPGRLSHIVCGLLIFMICTALFGAQRAGANIDPNFIRPGSVIMFGFATFMIFVATVYKNWRDQAPEKLKLSEDLILGRKDEADFLARAKERSGD
jgi:hypothetical protein